MIARILDANANRAREALRMLEDYARLGLNDAALSAQLKTLRHTLAGALEQLHLQDALCHRDTPNDVGTSIKTARELSRDSLTEVVIAAGKRLSEALRVLEELAKTINPSTAATIEQLRYQGYSIEKTLSMTAQQLRVGGGAALFQQVGLYVLLTEALCKHPWEYTLEALLDGGAQAIQLREKNLPDVELLRRSRIFVDRCRKHNSAVVSEGGQQAVIPIINDRADIAQLIGLNEPGLMGGGGGVHVGQTDLPCVELRRLFGQGLIIGVSTENLTQAHEAVRQGASYIGVGPMFATTTKEKPQLVGPPYAKEACETIPIPCVAIGGITLQNLPELLAVGVRSVAVCASVISTDDPATACRAFRSALNPT